MTDARDGDGDGDRDRDRDRRPIPAIVLRAVAIIAIHAACWVGLILVLVWLIPAAEDALWLVFGIIAIGQTAQRLYEEFYEDDVADDGDGDGSDGDEDEALDLTAGPDELAIAAENMDDRQTDDNS